MTFMVSDSQYSWPYSSDSWASCFSCKVLKCVCYSKKICNSETGSLHLDVVELWFIDFYCLYSEYTSKILKCVYIQVCKLLIVECFRFHKMFAGKCIRVAWRQQRDKELRIILRWWTTTWRMLAPACRLRARWTTMQNISSAWCMDFTSSRRSESCVMSLSLPKVAALLTLFHLSWSVIFVSVCYLLAVLETSSVSVSVTLFLHFGFSCR